MSRTDVHRPMRVQMLDPLVRDWFVDSHDHSTGPCDLNIFLAELSIERWIRTRCCRQPRTCPNLCGCDLCTGRPGRKLNRRRERVAWRATARQILALVDRVDVDVPPPPRGRAW
ncbi:hypothetical protein I0C86_30970 [Plantactinospora sp. S1510]|uniref:Transposase n=1 Tax=Plantactinospora alkalitolerans TaxID=2789879 RepID=A0ABS0H4G3_9ACTN|nr:hypothetical protein [Plantactinospora alkalitolerans]MBF9133350.1 hypothetical protein [Plantactinospora alkalitolerans]